MVGPNLVKMISNIQQHYLCQQQWDGYSPYGLPKEDKRFWAEFKN